AESSSLAICPRPARNGSTCGTGTTSPIARTPRAPRCSASTSSRSSRLPRSVGRSSPSPEHRRPLEARASFGQEEPEMEFVLLIQSRRGETPRAEVGFEEMGKFAEELAQAGVLRGAAGPLAPESEGARVRVRDGRAAVTNGPFGETRDVLGGFFAIEVAD